MARPTREEQAKKSRKQRVKFGDARLRMSIDPATAEKMKREGLVPRWVNDVKGRIPELQLRGYDFVRDPEKEIQAGEDNKNTDMGSAVSKIVGTNADGSPMRAYLMAQDKENYDEDQRLKEEINMKVDEAIRAGEPMGPNAASVNSKDGKTYAKNIEYQP
jgi:hypothetical protein